MSRIERVREEFSNLNIEGLLVTTAKNVRYLANFTGSAGIVLITKNESYFITDFRYTEQAREQAKGFKVIIHQNGIYNEVKEILEKENIQLLGIEADDMNVSTYSQLSELFEAVLVQTSAVVEKIRQIKDQSEIAAIQEACRITDQAFDHILTFIKPGVSEIEVANELERFVKTKGSSGMSFETIVASGVRSSMPHGVASEKLIEEGDLVTLDFGCYYQGYTSDMTRTIAVGEVDDKLKEIYQIVLEANEKVTAATKAGMTGKEVDAIARDYISEAGYGDNFGHSTGHGIGLDIHEGPGISFRNEEALVVNEVITNEPGIYIEGLGGVRIEDDLIVNEDGVTVLNKSPKNLIIL